MLGRKKGVKIIFSESFACVYHMSLTGKILYTFSDLFCVQWNDLKEKFPKAEYIGRLQTDANYNATQKGVSSGTYCMILSDLENRQRLCSCDCWKHKI